MRAFWKRAWAVSAAAGLAVAALAGCRGNGKEMPGSGDGLGADSKEEGQAMGRYLETDVAMPEGIASVLDLVKMEGNQIRILGMEESGYALWDSGDSGETWEKKGELDPEAFGEEGVWIGDAALSPTGEGFLCGYDEDGSMRYYYMTAQAQTQEVNLELGELEVNGMDEEVDGADQEPEDTKSETGEAQPDTKNEIGEAQPDTKNGTGEAQPDTGDMTEEALSGDGEDSREEAQPEDTEDPAEEGSHPDSAESMTATVRGVDADGQAIYEMNMTNSLLDIKYSSDGILYGNDMNSVLYRIDPKKGELKELAAEVPAFEIVGDTVIAEDLSSAVVMYDAASGETVSRDQILADVIREAGGMASFVAGVKNILFQEGEENSVYYCSSQGLYRHILGGTVNEQVIDGSLNSLGSPDTGLAGMCAADDGVFLILVSQSDGGNRILKYTYSKDTPSRPSRELKLYALKDSAEIRQAISMFQKEHADYYINFEVGLEEDSGVTAADALKTLNAEIMAGKGPDILILDGMPVQSYIEKGLLEDLTDLYTALKEGDGCFEQIARTYQTEEGIYAIPSRFLVPVIEGSGKLLDGTGDLKTFADEIGRLRKEDAEISGIIECSSPDILTEKLYSSYSPALVREDGSLDEKKAEEFYTQLKKIYDTGKYSDEEIENVTYSVHAAGASMWTDLSMGTMGLLGGTMKANLGMLGDVDGFNQMMAVGREKALDYDLLRLAGKKVYCPGTILGINSRSGQTEDAGRFVEFVLGRDVQAINQGGGFPVNKKAYEESTVDHSGGEIVTGIVSGDVSTGEMVSLDISWASPEAFEGLYEKLEELDTPCLTDSVIGEAVKEGAVKCLTGECTAEEAAKSLSQKVALYLAE